MRHAFAIGVLVVLVSKPALGFDEAPLPKVAEGWSIELVAKAPEIAYPTAVVVAPDGTVFLGQDPMDMPGPPTEPIDSVVTLRGGKVATFAEKLWAVMGLEWLDGTLYVVHAPYLSAFRDTDGDGKADSRVDLITGLGPKLPGFSGLNDHIASGIKLGMDGFLYIAVGDKGIPRGVGKDGTTITMSSGGVIRIRPDGTGLEVVSTGERNPLSVALTADDNIFTFGNDDDSKKWPNSLTHHVVGGHFGYPYEFLTAPFRTLPIVDGQLGGAGAQGTCYNEDGLPPRYRGNLFFCDWGLQAVIRYVVEPLGGTFRVVSKGLLVEKGELSDFRPFSLAVGPDGASFYLVDWGFNGWLSSGPKSGRLFRLTYTGRDRVEPRPRPANRIEALDHPALSVRLESQRLIVSEGSKAVGSLVVRLTSSESGPGRIHSLWALDAIGTPEARSAIRSRLADTDAKVRLQAVRCAGIRRNREALRLLESALRDPSPAVRREAAIALGRLGDSSAGPSLYAALGDADPFAAWSTRRAIRTLVAWDLPSLSSALADPTRREDALKLADESWNLLAVRALAASLETSNDPAWKARVVSALAGNYRRYPEWAGGWFGTNPLAGAMPRKTVDWDAEGMNAILVGLTKGLRDADAIVRRQAIGGLIGVGERATPLLRVQLDRETDSINLASIARALGTQGDVRAVSSLAKLLLDPDRTVEVRIESLNALAAMNSPQALKARLSLAYDSKAPEELVARALPALGRARLLPANDLEGFLYHKSELIRAASLTSFPTSKPLPSGIELAFLDRLDDPSGVVAKAAIEAVATHKLVRAVPKLISLASNEGTRVEATRSLSLMPDPRAIPVYVAALYDRDPAVRKAGESALMTIRGKTSAELESMSKAGKFVGPSAQAVERILNTPGSVRLEGLRAFALSHQGDARNGEALFFEARGIGCVKCHAVGGKGGSTVGPDLTGLAAKYDKAEIVRSVLEPSSRIATGFQPLVIAKHDGTIVTGILRAEDPMHLDLVDSEGKSFRVAKADIENQKVGDVSMMPAGLVDSLSPVEFADLIAYLASPKAKNH
jgi:putative heme-binding domain-containing protein